MFYSNFFYISSYKMHVMSKSACILLNYRVLLCRFDKYVRIEREFWRYIYLEKLRQTLRVRKERAILVAAVLRGRGESDDLAELTALAESAGAIVVDRFQQKIRTINPSTYIGKGKAEQLAGRVKKFKANVVIFDNDLSPGQIRELEEIIEIKVIDRSELILPGRRPNRPNYRLNWLNWNIHTHD